MVKVLENKVIDLDIVPGQEQIDIQRQVREQLRQARPGQSGETPSDGTGENGPAADKALSDAIDKAVASGQSEVDIPKEALPAGNASKGAQEKGFGGKLVDGSGKVVTGIAGTTGGVLKNVGDTVGNTIYDLGSGLGKTGTGAVSGLTDAVSSPFKDEGSQQLNASDSKGLESNTPDAEEERILERGGVGQDKH